MGMDIAKVKAIGKEIQTSFLASCQNRSDYELTVLNIFDHATPQRRYKQCLDEMVRKVSGIGRAEIDREEIQDKLQQAKETEAKAEGASKREANRNKRKLEINLWELNLAIEGQLREFATLHALYANMQKYTAEEIQAAEAEYHIRSKTAAAQRQIESGRGVDPELLRVMTDMSLMPNDHSEKFLSFLSNQKEIAHDNDLSQVSPE